MSAMPLHFEYRDREGKESAWRLTDWREIGLYIKATTEEGPRTFRKDRVLAYIGGCEEHLDDPHPPAPAVPDKADPSKVVDILFSCFKQADKDVLIAKARSKGFVVRDNKVTKHLHYVCFGTVNVAPKKYEQVMAQNVCILTEEEFHELADFGVLPG